MELDEILAMTNEERCKLRLKRRRPSKRRKPYIRHDRPAYSKTQLLSYYKEKELTSINSLLKKRTFLDPMPSDYIKAFGSWQAVKDMVHGPSLIKPDVELEYMMKCITQFQLWTFRDYQRVRKKRPDILPSIYRINQRWGNWGNLTQCALLSSFKKTLDNYLALRDKMEKIPSVNECKRNGINLIPVLNHFGTKRELDTLVNLL